MTETVVITGASAGIGRATAELFGKRGANVVLIARGLDGLQAAAKAIEEAGGAALAVPADVSDFQAVDEAAALAETTFGPIDIWVNVAFTAVFAPFWEIKPEEFRRVTEVNYLGFVHGTMAALSRMRPRNQGTVVQVGSALGYRAIPLQSAYCGAKHAINGFTESVRTELMHDRSKVAITIVQMPAVNTPQEVAAEGIVFAADHPDRKEYWVGASTVGTIMAQKFAAPLLDQYLARTGYDSQQTGEWEASGRPTNLWQPIDQPPGSDQGAHGRFDDQSKPRSAQLTVTERVEEAGATVRRAFDNLLGAARPRPPKQQPQQETWSQATSEQTDSDALQAGHDTTPPAQSSTPPTQSTPSPAEATPSGAEERTLSVSGTDLPTPTDAAPAPTPPQPPLTGMDVPSPADTDDPVTDQPDQPQP